MAATWDVDDELYVPVKVVSVTTDDTGTVYQVKMVAQDKSVTQYFNEDELEESTTSA